VGGEHRDPEFPNLKVPKTKWTSWNAEYLPVIAPELIAATRRRTKVRSHKTRQKKGDFPAVGTKDGPGGIMLHISRSRKSTRKARGKIRGKRADRI